VIERLAQRPRIKSLDEIDLKTAFYIGLCQCVAMIPGVSRSGATIMGARIFRVDRATAAEFSFFLAMPTMLGATVYDLYKNWSSLSWDHGGVIALGFVAAFVAAMLVTLMGPNSKVAKRADFEALGIPTYLSPSACSTEQTGKDAYGSRDQLWTMDLLYREIDELSRIFDVADRGEALIADFKAREAALRAQFKPDADLTFLFWFSSPSPSDDAYLGGGNGPSGYIADVLGGRNAIATDAEWPTLGWEGIMAADPKVIVAAQVDRNRWDLDTAENKIALLTADPTISQMEAVRAGRIVVMSGAAMNPSIRTLYGAEQVAEQIRTIDLSQ